MGKFGAVLTKIKALPFRELLFFAFGISLTVIVVGLVVQKALPPQVPLFYGLPESDKQLAPSLAIILPSFLSLLLSLINTTLACVVKEDFLKKVLIIAAFICTLLTAITTIKIIFLVGSL